ncbi:hypothetical protein B7463_g9817, partial [Scytalidium lignicola]
MDQREEAVKATKACLKCRRLKAAAPRDNSSPNFANGDWIQQNRSFQAVLNRLDAIESFLAFNVPPSPEITHDINFKYNENSQDPSLLGIWQALAQLRKNPRPVQNNKIWSQDIVRQLWLDFHKSMPGLHFLPQKQTFSVPTPLLLASMLYLSSLHHSSPEYATLSPDYFTVMCAAIAELAFPQPITVDSPKPTALTSEENAFQDILGIILAALTCEASTTTTGVWISIAYRLMLESCPKGMDERSRQWQGLFAGLQIIDLEHASLHMSCPILPLHAPLARLHTSPEDDVNSLSQMMHTGLTHFTGRGLPTIWSCFSPSAEEPILSSSFTPIDAAVIRDWASQLDRWLARFNTRSRRSETDPKLIFRQYILHRLLVLSIYHPARGFNLFSTSTTSRERRELLVSARAALKMQMDDKSIWANWDFVMITWAALLVLQGIEGGVGEDDDLPMVQDLLNTLRATHEPPSGLRNQLANKLEATFQNIHTPPAAVSPEQRQPNITDDLSWSIFDDVSLQFLYQPQWPIEQPLQQPLQ